MQCGFDEDISSYFTVDLFLALGQLCKWCGMLDRAQKFFEDVVHESGHVGHQFTMLMMLTS